MFPKNRINIIYRFLCFISYAAVILLINKSITLFILLLAYFFLALSEQSFRNIEFVVVTLIILLLCYFINNYLLFKVMLVIDYCFYFLDTTYYIVEKETVKVSKNDYVRFVKVKKKKGSNNITAVYLTVHLVLLLLAIVVAR